jgi:hypothetical protein
VADWFVDQLTGVVVFSRRPVRCPLGELPEFLGRTARGDPIDEAPSGGRPGRVEDTDSPRDAMQACSDEIGMVLPGRVVVGEMRTSTPCRTSACSGRHFFDRCALQVAAMFHFQSRSTLASPSTTTIKRESARSPQCSAVLSAQPLRWQRKK